MKKRTPPGVARRWLGRFLDSVDRAAFHDPDLDATARGWQVRRERRFSRTYRDPRWDGVVTRPSSPDNGAGGGSTEAVGVS